MEGASIEPVYQGLGPEDLIPVTSLRALELRASVVTRVDLAMRVVEIHPWAGIPEVRHPSFELTQVATAEAPAPSSTLMVLSDGAGTHGSLADALAAAAPGATILLERGVHRLPHGLLLTQPVTLVGEGMDLTQVVGEDGDWVLGYAGTGLLRLADLAVRWDGPPTRLANVVSVWNGEVRIERCRLAGAPSSESYVGAGLEISGSVHGAVRWCRMEANGSGIQVGGEADPLLENNTCCGNAGSGIRYRGDAAGSARRNVCTDNGHDGIALEQRAHPALDANTLQGNGWSGIAAYGPGGGAAHRNRCTGNGHSGIYLAATARPYLQANTCEKNQDSGICYVGSAGGTARENTCIGNQKYGICVAEQARPDLGDNECRENRDSGIAYFGVGGGTACRNLSSANGHYAIYVSEHAHPALHDNTPPHPSLSPWGRG